MSSYATRYESVALICFASFDLPLPQSKRRTSGLSAFTSAKQSHWIILFDGKSVKALRGCMLDNPEMQILDDIGFPVGKTLKPIEQYNEARLIVNPNFAASTDGHIMFQHHGQKVWLKNIRLRVLKAD